jgi:hypothetical protein
MTNSFFFSLMVHTIVALWTGALAAAWAGTISTSIGAGFAFLGVIGNAIEPISRVRITTGNSILGSIEGAGRMFRQ